MFCFVCLFVCVCVMREAYAMPRAGLEQEKRPRRVHQIAKKQNFPQTILDPTSSQSMHNEDEQTVFLMRMIYYSISLLVYKRGSIKHA